MSAETVDRIREAIKTVQKEQCRCVRCGECRGSGTIWLDMNGRYLGISRCDDLDQLEPCEQCGSSGIVETCDRCQLLDDMYHELDDLEERP